MKKGIKIIATLFTTVALAGCSCHKNVVNVQIKNDSTVVEDNKNAVLTKQDIYNYIKKTNPEAINKAFINALIEKILKSDSGFAGEEFEAAYNAKVIEYFKDKFVESEDYKINGEFNEGLLVHKLRNELNKIGDPLPDSQGMKINDEVTLKYDYSKYIETVVNDEVYMNMLKEDYILNHKKSILDNSESRIITIYSTEKLADMEEIVANLFSEDETKKYSSLEDLENIKKDEEKKEIARQYCENLGIKPNPNYGYESENCKPSASSYDISYNKFTTCKNGKRCTLQEGFNYQIELIDKKEYVKEQTVNKKSKDVLYPDIFNHLVRDNVNDYLVSQETMKKVFGENNTVKGRFLINNLYKDEDPSKFSPKDIILSSGPETTCYIVLVREVDSTTVDPLDKTSAVKLLLDKVTDASVLLHYVEGMKVELIDQQLIDDYKDLFA